MEQPTGLMPSVSGEAAEKYTRPKSHSHSAASGEGKAASEASSSERRFYNADAVARLAAGYDAAISTFNPGWSGPDIYNHQVKGTEAIIKGVKQADMKRMLFVAGAGSLEVKPGVQSVDTPEFPKDWRQRAHATREALNQLRIESGLEWSLLSPSADLAPGQRTGKFQVGTDQLLKNAEGGRKPHLGRGLCDGDDQRSEMADPCPATLAAPYGGVLKP